MRHSERNGESPLQRLLVDIVSESPDDAYIVTMDFHKIIYLLSQKLPEDHSLQKYMPFYWYKHGPLSEAVSQELNVLQEEEILRSEEKKQGTKFVKEENSISSCEKAPELEKARRLLQQIVEEYDFHKSRKEVLREEIYPNAPYEFQPYYKYKVLPAITKIQGGLSKFLSHPEYKGVLSVLSKAEAKLPLKKEFRSFNALFSRFVSLTTQSLKHVQKKHISTVHEYLAEIGEPIYDVFCKKLRTVAYDPPYQEQVKHWEKRYHSEFTCVQRKLGDFESFVANHLEKSFIDSVSRLPPNSAWGVVAKELTKDG